MIVFLLFGLVGGFLLGFLLNALSKEDNDYKTCVGAMVISAMLFRLTFSILATAAPEYGPFLVLAAASILPALTLIIAIRWMLALSWTHTIIGTCVGTVYVVVGRIALAMLFSTATSTAP